MKYTVNTFNDALEDLKSIKKYLTKFYPSTVRKFMQLYRYQISALKQYPYSHEKFSYDEDYRRVVFGKYLIFLLVLCCLGTDKGGRV